MKMKRIIWGLVFSAGLGLLGAGELWAQTATDVVCTGCVGSTDIADGGVATVDLKTKAVGNAKLKDGAVTGVKVKDESLTGADIADGSITAADLAPAPAPPTGYDSGTRIVWREGERETVFLRIPSTSCPASTAPDPDTWLTVDIPILDGTAAKAAIVYGHAVATQDGTGEPNGISVSVSKNGVVSSLTSVEVAQSLVALANQASDEHSMTIVDLDENRDFKVYYHFGDDGFTADETMLCFWVARVELMGWIEGE